MNPADLALPPKFPAWRPIGSTRTQYDAIVAAACSDKRFTILNAPTGIGKSAIYMGLSSLLGVRALVLTQTTFLQTQLMEDFRAMGLAEIKGQHRYPCLYFDDGSRRRLPGCDEGPCHAGIECVLREGGCTYYDAVRHAGRSRLVVTNQSYHMHIRRFSDPLALGQFGLLILDEAHESADSLAEFVKIKLSSRKVEQLLEIAVPRGASINEWSEWAAEVALPVCRARLESARALTSLSHHGISVLRYLKDINRALTDLAAAWAWRRLDAPDPPAWVPGTSTDWVIEEATDEVTFQPVWASGYSEEYLFAKIPRIVLVSATVTPKDAQFLGIPRDDFDYHQYPSPFPRSIRPFFVIPTVKVSRKITEGETRIWLNRIDQIIEEEAINRRQKGIIHSISYEWAKLIYARSRFRDIIEIHDKRSVRDAIKVFRDAKPPRVLLSPAVSTGWDFPMDQARFQIIAKLPFIDSRPEIIRARIRSDKHYSDYVTMVTLIQMAGRGVRSSDDFCRTYLIDDNWSSWFYPRNKKLVPRWFQSAVRRVRSLEEALQR